MSEQQALTSRPEAQGGRAVSAQNARRHGILAEGVTAGEEDQMARVASAFHDDLQPVGMVESALVEKIALTYLQLQRCAQAEAALFESAWRPNTSACLPNGDLGTGSSLHLAPLDRIATLIARYDTTLTNRMLKLLQTLAMRQILRRGPAQQPRRSGEPTAGSGELNAPSEGAEWAPEGVSRNGAGREEPRRSGELGEASEGSEWAPEPVSRNGTARQVPRSGEPAAGSAPPQHPAPAPSTASGGRGPKTDQIRQEGDGE